MLRLPDTNPFKIANPEDILLAPKPWFVLLTLAFAFVLNLLPLTGVWLALRPDFFSLILLYWAIHQPQWIGIGIAFFCGLMTDVVEANRFGQHALAYAILAFSAGYFQNRVLRFPLWQQSLHVLSLLLLAQIVVVVLRLMTDASVPGIALFLASFSGALIWPMASMLLQWPQRVRSLVD